MQAVHQTIIHRSLAQNLKTLAMDPKRSAPPPPVDSDEEEEDSSSEEEEEDSSSEEEEEYSSSEEEEEEEEQGKVTNPPPASSEAKKPARVWSKDDSVRILEALSAHRRDHGTLPQPDELEAALAGSLDRSDYGRKDLLGKVKSLKAAHTRQSNRGKQPSKDSDSRIYNLSKQVWGRGDMMLADGTVPRDFAQVCELYPHFADEVKEVEKTHPGLFTREFAMISDDKARALDTKLKKLRLMQGKVDLLRNENLKEVIKVLTDLLDGLD